MILKNVITIGEAKKEREIQLNKDEVLTEELKKFILFEDSEEE